MNHSFVLNWLWAIIILFFLVVSIFFIIWLPKKQIKSLDNLTIDNETRMNLENEFRRTAISFFGGITVILTLLVAWQQNFLQNATQDRSLTHTDFSDGVAKLASNSEISQIGGILILEDVLNKLPRFRNRVILQLSHFIRITKSVGKQPADYRLAPCTVSQKNTYEDSIQIAIDVISNKHRPATSEVEWGLINLGATNDDNKVNLSGFRLQQANFERANLRGIIMRGATPLTGAIFRGADLLGSDLTQADLRGARMEWIELAKGEVPVIGSRDFNENRRVTRLDNATLCGATLIGAHLEGAILDGAKLQFLEEPGKPKIKTNLTDAKLSYASLREANLTGAILKGADLTGACLEGTVLTDSDVTQDQLDAALGKPSGNLVGLRAHARPCQPDR